jgi:hypothetical protein
MFPAFGNDLPEFLLLVRPQERRNPGLTLLENSLDLWTVTVPDLAHGVVILMYYGPDLNLLLRVKIKLARQA